MRVGGQPTTELPIPDRYGGDLAARLHRLQTNRPGSVAAWLEHLRPLVGWREMHTPVHRGAVRPRFLEGKNPVPVDLLHVSDGSVVQAYLAALVLDPPEETSIYLLDDPGMPYFPNDAARGADLVQALAGTRQVIVATHSVSLVETVGNLDNVWKIERDAGALSCLTRLGREDDLFAEDVAVRGVGEAAFAATRSIAMALEEEE
jgi:predicted ATPase